MVFIIIVSEHLKAINQFILTTPLSEREVVAVFHRWGNESRKDIGLRLDPANHLSTCRISC